MVNVVGYKCGDTSTIHVACILDSDFCVTS